MPAAADATARPSWPATARVWVFHGLCFVLPVTSLAFLATAPHEGARALLWLLVLVASVVADVWSPGERRQPLPTLPGWPFDSVLWVLAAMHVAILGLWIHMVAAHGFWQLQ